MAFIYADWVANYIMHVSCVHKRLSTIMHHECNHADRTLYLIHVVRLRSKRHVVILHYTLLQTLVLLLACISLTILTLIDALPNQNHLICLESVSNRRSVFCLNAPTLNVTHSNSKRLVCQDLYLIYTCYYHVKVHLKFGLISIYQCWCWYTERFTSAQDT